MTLTYKYRLRYRRLEECPKANALPLVNSSTTSMNIKPMYAKTTMMKDGKARRVEEANAGKDFRFVRVKDQLFKVKQSNNCVPVE